MVFGPPSPRPWTCSSSRSPFTKLSTVTTFVRRIAIAAGISTAIIVLASAKHSFSRGQITSRLDVRVKDPQSSPISTSDARGEVTETKQCLPYIFYDKPVKTGSTAIRMALMGYLEHVSEPPLYCPENNECTKESEAICVGAKPRGHLTSHVRINESVTSCLRRKGYYHVTSIRDPKERILSSWRYSTTMKRDFRGIPYNATLEEYVQRYPRCTLLYYYDRKDKRCANEDALERAEVIAERFDEVIDLSDDVIGDVHRRIKPFLTEVNVAPGGRSRAAELQIPDELVEMEYLLYNKLREKRVSLAERPKRVLCKK